MERLTPAIESFVAQAIGTKNFEVPQLAGDASSRKYYRVVYGDQSRVLMSWEPFGDPARYPFLNVQAHLQRAGVRVPVIEGIDGELGVLLLEDLGDLTLERKYWESQSPSAALPDYALAVDQLVKIHFAASRPVEPPALCQQVQFDTAKFMWEMNYAREHFLETLGGVQLAAADPARLQKEFLNICERLDAQPKFVCHRDYHSRNLMLKLGRVYVIDFQDARLGPIQYDLVSLVHDSYVDLDFDSIAKVKNDYIQKAKAAGPAGVIRPDFEEIFALQTIQRCFKACGSFASFFNARGDTRYLKYLRPTVNLVAKTLQDSGTAPLLASVLLNSGLLERHFVIAT